MAVMSTITCPSDCAVTNLPVINFQDCNPQILSSELQELILGRSDAISFTDASAATEWNDRISSNNTPPGSSTAAVKDLLRRLKIIGDIPAPTETTRAISGGRTAVTGKVYTMNIEIDDMSNENWQFCQTVQCSKAGLKVKAWPITKSGHFLGGNTGISATLKINHLLDRGEDGIMRAVGTLEFKTFVFPNRDVFPLAS